MFRLICLAIGYAIGCFQTAYIVGRAMGKIDIREHGSGNAGMTNITRVMGPKAGLIVFVCDILKAVVGYYICSLIFNGSATLMPGDGVLGALPGLYGGLGVILGHNFPFYLKFKGGKGMSALIGVILSFDIRIALIIFSLGIICVLMTKIISIASLIIAGLLPLFMIVFGFPLEAIILGFVIMGISYYQHRQNISRLFKGTENKFNLKKQEDKV